jgi:hypothetical protein
MPLKITSVASIALMTIALALSPNLASAASTAAPAATKTTKQCDAEYTANKGAIQASGQKKKDFVAACLAGTEVIPAAAPTTAVAPAPTTTPAPTTKIVPTPTKATPAPAATTTPTGANQFATEALAKAHCPTGVVVWVNLKSKIFHFSGNKDYGTTKQGAYMCEADTSAEGFRAAKNEKQP